MITEERYGNLLKAEVKLEILVTTLYRTAELNYRKTGLRFDDDTIDTMLSALDPARREAAFSHLLRKTKKEEEEREQVSES